jgi:hypothetical protein
MHPRLRRFLDGFSYQINYKALLLIAVNAAALAGALIGAFVFQDMAAIILLGGGFYLAGRLLIWAKFRCW